MALLTRGHAPLRSQLRSQSYKLSALQHPHPSVCYLSLFSTSANHANRKTTTTTTTQSSTSSNTNTNTTVTTPTRGEINAPISTFPAPIEVPPQNPSSSSTSIDKIKRLVSTGRAYLTFYKTGLKNVFRNYRASLPLRKTLGLPIYLPVSPPRNHSHSHNATAAALGRGQFQLVRRSARDVRRMIPFTLILIICGEFTPLIVPIFGSAITPATCRVPSQITKEREAGSKRKYLALTAHANSQAAQQAQAGTMPTSIQIGSEQEMTLLATRFANAEFARTADASGVLAASAVFGIVKSHQPRLGSVLMGPVYRPRLRKYIRYLEIDDGMIREGGGVRGLSSEEVKFALEERGLGDVASILQKGRKAEDVERRALEMWLEARKG